jgi:hypothetical protein
MDVIRDGLAACKLGDYIVLHDKDGKTIEGHLEGVIGDAVVGGVDLSASDVQTAGATLIVNGIKYTPNQYMERVFIAGGNIANPFLTIQGKDIKKN